MSVGTESVLFNAVPLLVLAAAYAIASGALLPRLWRLRRRARPADLAVGAVYPSLAVAAAVYGAVVANDAEPIGGHVWPPFAATVVALVPAALLLVGWRDLDAVLTGPRAREAEEQASARDRDLDAIGRLAMPLSRADEPGAVARILLDELVDLLGVGFAGLALIDDGGREAFGLVARVRDGGATRDADWWRSVRVDLEHEPSGIASACFEAAPVAVYDVEASSKVSRRLAAAADARSALFVPLVAAGRVTAVLALATTTEKRVFTRDELRLVNALAGEAAQALERTRSAGALREALERERLLSEIARRVRSELDPGAVARVAVAETGRALALSRCFIRLGGADEDVSLEAEWQAAELPPVADARALPASNLAARELRTVAVTDVERAPELSEPDALLAVGTRAVLATPIVVFEQLIGVLALHRPLPSPWTQAEVALAETIAREVGLALQTARLLAENERRLAQQRAVVLAANDVAGELDLDSVLQRLVDEVATLVGGETADLCLHDRERGVLRVAAVHGLPPDVVGFEFPDDSGLAGLAVRDRRSVLVDAAARLERPVRHEALAPGSHAMCTPLAWSGELRGTLGVTRRGRAFSAADLDALEAFANLAALALRTASLLRENRSVVEQQKALLRAAQAMAAELRPGTVLQRLVDEVTALVGADAADCYLYDAERDVLRCAAVSGLPEELVGLEFTPGANVRAALDAGAPATSNEDPARRDAIPHPAYASFERALVAPMTWGGVTSGLLGVGTRDPARRFTDADAEALEAYATLGSLALRNAHAFEERTRQARIERGFFRIAAVLGEPLSLSETLGAVAQAASEALGGAAAAVLMPAEGLELAGSHALPPAVEEAFAEGLPEAVSVLAACARERRVLAAPVVREDDRFGAAWRLLAARAGFQSLLAIPVGAPRTDAGGLVVVLFSEPRVFADDDLELARQLARAARGALERSELFEKERTSRALSQELARTGSLLASELEPGAVLDEVVEQARPLLRADACAVRVLQGDELVLQSVAGDGLEELVGGAVPSTARIAGDVLQTRAPVALADAGGDERLAESEPLLAQGYAAYVGVPLVAAEAGVHGVLAALSRRPRAWRPEEVEALAALAGNAATAVSNAELYQRVALERQQSFAILSNIADGIVAVDREGAVVLWNTAAERITGVPGEEALGRPPAQVLGRDLSAGGGAAGERLLSIHRGGQEVALSLTEAVMRDPTGAVAGRIYAFRDISAERMVEQMKSDFVSNVSERLRRPLTSIYGFAETLLREDVEFGETERRTFLGYIASESERLAEIVDALLNVARLDVGDVQIAIAPTDVASVVNDVVATAEVSARGNGHRFVVDLPRGPLAAQADADRLRQILLNLVDNAVKFSPRGGTVTVGARRKGETVEMRVVDEGVGIPAAEHARIFTKFYRGGAEGGTGLGLFIVQGLVTAMGGRIRVDSKEGVGSSFIFELPLARA